MMCENIDNNDTDVNDSNNIDISEITFGYNVDNAYDTDDVEEDIVPVYTKRCHIDAKLHSDILDAIVASNEIDSINTDSMVQKIEEKAVSIALKYITMHVNINYKTLTEGTEHARETRDNITTICLSAYQLAINTRNAQVTDKKMWYKYPHKLSPESIAAIMLQCNDIRVVQLQTNKRIGDTETTVKSTNNKIPCVRIRDAHDSMHGLFVFNTEKSDTLLNRIIFNLSYAGDARTQNTIVSIVESNAKIINAYSGVNLVACKNGVYDCETDTFTEWFTDNYEDKYGDIAFMAKCPVNYNANAIDVNLPLPDGTRYSANMQIASIFEGQHGAETLQKALLQLINHAVRGDGQGYAAFFTNTSGAVKGGGGKSTVLQIIRNLVGESSICNVKIDDYDKNHALDGIIGKTCVLSDESSIANKPLSTDAVTTFKALVMSEPITIELKYKTPMAVRFSGTVVQSMNDVPRFKNSDDALFRRVLVLPFERLFAKVGERMDIIKDSYIYRTDFLEYLLKIVLEMGVCNYTQDVLKVCNGTETKKLKSASNTVYQFMDEITDKYPGNTFEGFSCVPAAMLFDMFKIWYEDANSVKSTMGSTTFNKQLKKWVDEEEHNKDWKYKTGTIKHPAKYAGRVYVFRDFPTGNKWFNRSYLSGSIEWKPARLTSTGGIMYIGDGLEETRDIIHAFDGIRDARSDWNIINEKKAQDELVHKAEEIKAAQ